MKIAIYGVSTTGKTAIVSELAKLFKAQPEVRHCGELIKNRCKDIGLSSPIDLNIKEHKLIDQETIKVANSSDSILIEGRYLNFVLDGNEHVLFINLTCDFDERVNRLKRKLNTDYCRENIESSDIEDKKLSHKLYGTSQPTLKCLTTLNTTGLSITQCAEKIIDIVNKAKLCL